MSLLNTVKLEKLTIRCFNNAQREINFYKRQVEVESFSFMFNPETYSQYYENKYDRKQGINTSGRKAMYSFTLPERISLKLILDDTKVTEYQSLASLTASFGGASEPNVYQRVQDFLTKTCYMDGEIHEPKYLKLVWGQLNFDCRLGSVNVNYTLFDEHGRALRAELDTTFIHDIEPTERLQREQKSSPDLTHYRVVKTHDSLPLMCKAIYGSPHYYLWVARANDLQDFRDLKPGQEIYFPPIEK